jgi:regulator of replication initiation timing
MLCWLQDLDPFDQNLDPSSRELLARLLNQIEILSSENQKLTAENQRLRDELAYLKGHKGQPKIKPNRQAKTAQDSAQSKKNNPKNTIRPSSAPRKQQIKIDREEVVKLDRSQLPEDITHRGYREVTIQNIIFKTDTVLYRLERMYSESTGKFYEAQLPLGLRGQSYGHELSAFVLMEHFELRVPQQKILKLLQSQGIVISAGKISEILTQQYLEPFTRERNAVLKAGLASTTYQQIDDTGMRVNGENWYAATLCNPYYSSFFTTRRKNYSTVSQLLDALDNHHKILSTDSLNKPSLSQEKLAPRKRLGDYINILVADDAGQFHNQTQYRSLCWIHEGRHYEKLSPVIPLHQRILEEFLGDFWTYYHQLKAYQQAPVSVQQQQRLRLSEEFDRLFSRQTG